MMGLRLKYLRSANSNVSYEGYW